MGPKDEVLSLCRAQHSQFTEVGIMLQIKLT